MQNSADKATIILIPLSRGRRDALWRFKVIRDDGLVVGTALSLRDVQDLHRAITAELGTLLALYYREMEIRGQLRPDEQVPR